MQDVITALQADPQDPNIVHVFIDGRHAIAVSLDVAADERLTVGQPCPPDRLERLHRAQERQQAYELALNFLSYRPRSAREVEMRLRKKGYTPEQIEQTLARLRQRGYVDDREFARFWIGNRQSFSPRGPHLLRSELRQKGVPAEVVEEALAEYKDDQAQRAEEAAAVAAEYDLPEDEPVPGSDEATALALARKRMRLLAGLDPQVTRRRLYSFLARRGYGFDTIDTVVRRVLKAEQDDAAIEEEAACRVRKQVRKRVDSTLLRCYNQEVCAGETPPRSAEGERPAAPKLSGKVDRAAMVPLESSLVERRRSKAPTGPISQA